MRPQMIRARLKARQCTIVAIAKAAGITTAAVHRAINGQGRCAKAEESVAEALGTTRERLFGLNRRELARQCTKNTRGSTGASITEEC